MKGMRKVTTKNKLGFSLLELMVVVAIIGVLATFAVPRFNIFRARARQGEAKSNLGVIFTLQEAFKIDKETYYNGVGGAAGWGGAAMNSGIATSDDYVGYKATGGTNSICKANRLGFRLANCQAARYRYWVGIADEDDFLVHAFAPSDAQARIFPGCQGAASATNDVNDPKDSKSGKPRCQDEDNADFTATGATLTGTELGGDAFCLDQSRRVDNYRDIVIDEDCDK